MGTGLKYIPITDFHLIPPRLLEQVKPKNFDTEMIYAFSQHITSSPFNILGVFVDKDKIIRGFLWASINPLDKRLHAYILSVDPEYQNKGVGEEATNILKKLKEKYDLVCIEVKTTRPKALEKLGYKRSKQIVMEV
jgi:ribosomal protein S18 acetylase RimI-like enzyme